MRALIAAAAVAALLACGGEEATTSKKYSCAYQEQKGAKCGAAPSGAYVQKCINVEKGSPAYDTACKVLTSDTMTCGGGCCMYYAYRNLKFQDGDCASNGLTPL